MEESNANVSMNPEAAGESADLNTSSTSFAAIAEGNRPPQPDPLATAKDETQVTEQPGVAVTASFQDSRATAKAPASFQGSLAKGSFPDAEAATPEGQTTSTNATPVAKVNQPHKLMYR